MQPFGNQFTPPPQLPKIIRRDDLNAFTGGGANALDGQNLLAWPEMTTFGFVATTDPTIVEVVMVETSADITDEPNFVRAADWAVSGKGFRRMTMGLPFIITADWIVTTDQSGNVIPDGAYGNKGGIPYFGNTPLSDLVRQRVDFSQLVYDSLAIKFVTAKVLEYTIPAEAAVAGSDYVLDYEIHADNSPGGVFPNAANLMYLMVKFGAGAPVALNGGATFLTPVDSCARAWHKARVFFSTADDGLGMLRPVATSPYRIQALETTGVQTAATPLQSVLPGVTADPAAYTHPEGSPIPVEVYLVYNATVADAGVGSISGNIEIFKNPIVTGSFA